MYKLAELYHLTRIDWQFFGSLTFREPFLRNRETGVAAYRRICMWNEFGREVSRSLVYRRKGWEKIPTALRLETGEIGGLWHFHFLMTGVSKFSVNWGTCEFMESVWVRQVGGGHTKIRVFDTSQNGIEYVAKCLDPKNRYEFDKFRLAQSVTLSPAAVRVLNKPWRIMGVHRSATAENGRKPLDSTVSISTGPVPEMVKEGNKLTPLSTCESNGTDRDQTPLVEPSYK